MTQGDALRWSTTYLDRVELADKFSTRLNRLSSGQQQKIQLGVAIMSETDLHIPDEPTKGFDPVNRRLLLDVLDDQKRLGTTVVMVTHQMDEVERLCDRIILLKDGRAEAYGTVAAVQESFGGATVRMNFEGEIPDSSDNTVLRRDADYAVASCQILREA